MIINYKKKKTKKIKNLERTPPVGTEPTNLEEQLALEEARCNPGKEIDPDKLVIKDPIYPKEDWAKNQYEHKALDGKKTEIHYWENRHTGERNSFKFKDKQKQ